MTLEIKDFEIIPAPEPEPNGNPTYATLKAKIIVGNKYPIIIDKLIPKEKTVDEKKLTEDWEAMCKALNQVTITNRTTKEELHTVDSKDVTDLKDVSWKSSWIQSSAYKDKNGRIDMKKVKVEKSTVAGDVSDPYHYYYIYAKPSTESKQVIRIRDFACAK